MKVCESCGKSERDVLLYNVIGRNGITRMCELCTQSEGLPIAKEPTEEEAIRLALSKGIKKDLPVDLIENFHWTIQMSRRRAKLSQSQLADELQEKEETIKKLEIGKGPENEEERRTLKKIEQYFRIKLKKENDFMGDEIELVDND